jgi:hypothetical protein
VTTLRGSLLRGRRVQAMLGRVCDLYALSTIEEHRTWADAFGIPRSGSAPSGSNHWKRMPAEAPAD